MRTAKTRTPEEARRQARLLERRTQVMKALAHPSRLLMVDALAAGELCVCDLQELVGGDMSTVSKHLSLPELVILRKVLRPPLIAVFVGTVAAGILLVGYLFNAVL